MTRSTTSLMLTLVAATALSSQMAWAQGTPVKGSNLAQVVYGQGSSPSGSFVQTGPGTWIERNGDGRFDFREEGRDEWSVYLIKVGRQAGMRVQLDMYQRNVKTGGHQLYRILYAAAGTVPRPTPPGPRPPMPRPIPPRPVPPRPATVQYNVVLRTGSAAGSFGFEAAGTDSNVHIQLVGDRGQSDWIRVNTAGPACEANTSEVARIRCGNLGAIQTVRINKDGAGVGPDWFLKDVTVYRGNQRVAARQLAGWVQTGTHNLPLR